MLVFNGLVSDSIVIVQDSQCDHYFMFHNLTQYSRTSMA